MTKFQKHASNSTTIVKQETNKQKGRIWFGFALRVLLKFLFEVSCDWLEEKLQKNFYCKEKNVLK